MAKFGIGQSVRRLEDPRLLTGGGRYTDDTRLEGAAARDWAADLRRSATDGAVRLLDVACGSGKFPSTLVASGLPGQLPPTATFSSRKNGWS